MNRKMLVLNVAALSPWEIGSDCPTFESLSNDGTMRALAAPEPALTCVHLMRRCSLALSRRTTASLQMVGTMARRLTLPIGVAVTVWLLGRKFGRRQNGAPDFKTVNLFWRFCTHSSAEITLTERPTYFANGRKGADVYGQPQAFRDAVSAELGSFPFFHFGVPRRAFHPRNGSLTLRVKHCVMKPLIYCSVMPRVLTTKFKGLARSRMQHGGRCVRATTFIAP